MTVDLNSDLSQLSIDGQPIRCNSTQFGETLQCSSCTPDCNIQNTPLLVSSIQLVDVLEDEQSDTMLFVQTQESEILGLGPRRGKPGYPQNPFVSSIFHICFGQTKGFITREFKNPYDNVIHYDAKQSKYQVQLKQIVINNKPICNITQNTFLDSQQPYILLPEQQYEEMKLYLAQFGVVEKGRNLVITNDTAELPSISLIFAEDEKIIMKNDTYVYTLENESKIVAFYKSKINRIELGLPFLSQQLITIDQTESALYFSNYDCEGRFDQIQRDTHFTTQVLVPFIFICVVFYCILTQKGKKEAHRKQIEQQELTKLKEDEEDI